MAEAKQHRVISAAVYGENSLLIPVAYQWDDWLREAQDIQWRARALTWWLGDCFLFGEKRFGEIYAQAVENYSEETIKRAMRVCRIFPPHRRRLLRNGKNLGFSYHQAVEAMPTKDQDELLDLAVKNEWPREVFRDEVRARKAKLAEAEHEKQRELFRSRQPAQEPEPEQAAPAGAAPVIDLFPSAQDPDEQTDGVVEIADPSPATVPSGLSVEDAVALLTEAVDNRYLSDQITAAVRVVLNELALLRRQVPGPEKAVIGF